MAWPPATWVLADDRPGNANQAIGVAEALGWPFEVKAIRYRGFARLPNALLGASDQGLAPASRKALVPPWPDLVIAAGRRTAPVARWLKRRRSDVFLVQLMWPGSTRGLDLVAVPAHDATAARAPVIRTIGTPHRLTSTRLAAAARAVAARIAHLPRPRIVCLVGGATRHRPFTPDDARDLARAAGALARAAGGSLLVSTSRRSGAACTEALARALEGPHLLHRFGEAGDLHLGLLGSADGVVVTGESAAMCTEACALGRPVFVFRPAAGLVAKHERLLHQLEAAGHVRSLGAPWPERVPPPFNPADDLAAAIRARLAPAPVPASAVASA